MSLLKTFLKIMFAVFGSLQLAVTALFVLVDPNDFKAEVEQIVETETGREFELKSIELSVFPKIGLALQVIKMSNASGFSSQPFAQASSIVIGA